MDATSSGWTTGIHVGLLIALSLTLCVRAADAPPVKAGKPATITAVVNDSTLGSADNRFGCESRYGRRICTPTGGSEVAFGGSMLTPVFE